jgi:nicotinamidase-related amidase
MMTATSTRPRTSEKGLLTPNGCVVVLLDLQPQFVFGVSSTDRQSLINNNLILAKAARVFDIPVVISTTEPRAFGGNFCPQIQAVLPCLQPIERSTITAWENPEFVSAVQNTGRRRIVAAGLWTSTSIAFTTIQALYDGYEVCVVEDCCADVSAPIHTSAMSRLIQAGAKPVTSLAIMLEWQRDWAALETCDAVMDIAKNHCGAYGLGVEYAYTMIHGALPSSVRPYVVPGPADAVT